MTLATAVYWRRMSRTGNRMLLYYLSAFILCIFSELVFAVYKSVFDTFNVLGHLYKVTAFYLIYKGTFASSVNNPYVRLSDANENLRREIVERKRAEEALQKSSEEIRSLNAELEQRVEQRTAQLEATNKELEAFSYSVSHDLRAPLRGIDGFSQALLEDYREKLDEQGKDYLSRVRAATQRMAQLIDDLLKLSRITRSEILSEPVNLSDLALSVAEELRSAEPERKVEFVIRQEVMARGDVQLLRVVLQNLIGNAWKYTGKKPRARIEFGVTEKEGKPVYFVRDDGAGFDMAYAGKLFTAFQRLHKENEFAWKRNRPGPGAAYYPPPWRNGLGGGRGGQRRDRLFHTRQRLGRRYDLHFGETTSMSRPKGDNRTSCSASAETSASTVRSIFLSHLFGIFSMP